MTQNIAPIDDAPVVDKAFTDMKARIARHAARQARNYHITPAWVNPWLRKMGIDELAGRNEYVISVPVTGTVTVTGKGNTRAEAITEAKAYAGDFSRIRSNMRLKDVTPDAEAWQVTAGPEDPAPADVTEVPTTVDELKAVLRACLKAAVSDPNGPHSCVSGVRDEWNTFNLGTFPEARQITVQVPVTATVGLDFTVWDGDETDGLAAKILTEKIAAGNNYWTASNVQVTGQGNVVAEEDVDA